MQKIEQTFVKLTNGCNFDLKRKANRELVNWIADGRPLRKLVSFDQKKRISFCALQRVLLTFN